MSVIECFLFSVSIGAFVAAQFHPYCGKVLCALPSSNEYWLSSFMKEKLSPSFIARNQKSESSLF